MKNSGMMNPPRQPVTSAIGSPDQLAQAGDHEHAYRRWRVEQRLDLELAVGERVRRRDRQHPEGDAAEHRAWRRRACTSASRWSTATSTVNSTPIAAPSAPASSAHARSTPSIRSTTGKSPDRFEAEPAERRRHGVPAQCADRRRHERLVVLEAATVRDLEGEDRRAERGAEQHGEACRHARDRQCADVVGFEPNRVAVAVASVPVVVTSGASGPSVPPAPTDSSEIGISERRRPSAVCAQPSSSGSSSPVVVGHAVHVDVADEELDVGGSPEHADQHRDQRDRRRRGRRCGPRRSTRSGPSTSVYQFERAEVRRADRPAAEPDCATISATMRRRTPKNCASCLCRNPSRECVSTDTVDDRITIYRRNPGVGQAWRLRVCDPNVVNDHAVNENTSVTFGSQSSAVEIDHGDHAVGRRAVHADGEDERPVGGVVAQRHAFDEVAPDADGDHEREPEGRGRPGEDDHALDERGDAVEPRPTPVRAEQVGAGEDGDGDRARGDPRGGSASVGLERLEGPAQEHHRHDDEVEHEAEGERGEDREGEQFARSLRCRAAARRAPRPIRSRR